MQVKVSRGKSGMPKANFSNSPMVKHLKLHHPKKHLELMKKKDDKDRVVAEKRKASEAD